MTQVRCLVCYNHRSNRRRMCLICKSRRALPGCWTETCYIWTLQSCRDCAASAILALFPQEEQELVENSILTNITDFFGIDHKDDLLHLTSMINIVVFLTTSTFSFSVSVAFPQSKTYPLANFDFHSEYRSEQWHLERRAQTVNPQVELTHHGAPKGKTRQPSVLHKKRPRNTR